ncbi:MAG: sigma-70 family RNA polymerase sigma factor [Actinomycetia bacterium]|nr:sigma-70 family RNA polymerase sigma factor [Actinomycetes bacterium]MCP4961562.1 sigma-70 family RNA polymerase sigma factor [Actinomycetes bacterium]
MVDSRRARRRSRAQHHQAVPTWEEVAREHGAFIYTVAYRLTGNRAEAEDLVQDVLVRVQRGLRTFRPGSMQGWLSRITTNAFLDEVRRKKRRPTDALPDENPERVLPTSDAADDVLEQSTFSGEVQVALAQLSDDFRAALVLSDVVGLSYAEIAEALDTPIGTIRSRIHRARSQMRDVLDQDRSAT